MGAEYRSTATAKRTRMALGLLLSLGPGLAIAAEPGNDTPSNGELESDAPSAQTGRIAHDAGLQAYERGDYPEAMEQFELAYALDGHPGDLYGWAQAARSAGDCRTAIELYRRFIDLGPDGDARVAAQSNEARCTELLANEVRAPEPPLEPVPLVEPTPTPIDERPPVTRPDTLGVILVSVGGAGAIAGAIMLGAGEAQRAVQDEVDDYERFDALDGRIDGLHIAGGITLGVGLALAVVGTVRLAQRGRRRNQVTWSMGPMHVGLRLPLPRHRM